MKIYNVSKSKREGALSVRYTHELNIAHDTTYFCENINKRVKKHTFQIESRTTLPNSIGEQLCFYVTSEILPSCDCRHFRLFLKSERGMKYEEEKWEETEEER